MIALFYPGNVIKLRTTFQNRDTGSNEDPDTVTLYIKPHNGSQITVEMGDLTNDAVGVWSYLYTVPIDAQRDRYCWGFYGEDSGGDPYAYTESQFMILDACAVPTG